MKMKYFFSFIVIVKKYLAQVCVIQLNSDNVQCDPVSAVSTWSSCGCAAGPVTGAACLTLL